MISEVIIDSVIKNANIKDKDFLLKMFIMNLSEGYSYNDYKINHALEIMLNSDNIVKLEDIDMDYIVEHVSDFIYKAEEYNIKDITINSINNINGTIEIRYKYLAKMNEDRGDMDYSETYVNISFIDNPKMLKKS